MSEMQGTAIAVDDATTDFEGAEPGSGACEAHIALDGEFCARASAEGKMVGREWRRRRVAMSSFIVRLLEVVLKERVAGVNSWISMWVVKMAGSVEGKMTTFGGVGADWRRWGSCICRG